MEQVLRQEITGQERVVQLGLVGLRGSAKKLQRKKLQPRHLRLKIVLNR